MCGLATACSNWSATSMIDSRQNRLPLQRIEIKYDDPLLFKKVEIINSKMEDANPKNYTLNQFVCIGWTMKKEVFDKVGLMDERILSANDVSYTYLALKYGYISKTCWDMYLHHFWSVSGSQIGQPELVRRDTVDWKLILSDPLYKR
jgi:GT2 family glycosyltransferase